MDTLARDLRFACRQLVRRPLFSAAAIVTLALGMGLNAVVFSGVNALFLKGNAASHLDGAAWIFSTGPRQAHADVSLAEFARFAEATHEALDTAAMGRMPLAWQRQRSSETLWAQLVSTGYFDLLDTHPIVGRLPRTTGGGATPEAVISERLWRQRLDGAQIGGGLHLILNGLDHAIVGVLAESFRGPGGTFAPDVWTLLDRWRELGLPAALAAVDHRWLTMVGQIRPHASVPEVEARLAAAAADLARQWPATHERRGARIALMRDGHPELRSASWLGIAAMSGTGLVLLLACFNVASLLIARGLERQREIGIRAALGGGGARLVRQLVTEGLVLASASGLVTIVIAAWSQRLLGAFALPSPIPQRIDLSLDGTAIAFIAVLVVLAGVLPGLAPAWHATKVDLVAALSARGSIGTWPSRSRRVLLMAQVVGSTMLLAGAALFVQSAARLSLADPGFETAQALVIETEPALQGYDPSRTRLLVNRLADHLRAIPGIISVTAADRIPFYVAYPRTTPLSLSPGSCAAERCPVITTYAIDDGFFRTMGIPLVAGRELDSTSGQAGVVVSESLAASWWPHQSAVGEVVYLGEKGEPRVVHGVARDTRHRNLMEAVPTQTLYLPLADGDFAHAITLVARTDREPGALTLAAHDAMHHTAPAVPAQSVKTMAARLDGVLWPTRTATGFFAVCGGVALLLAAIGLFATVVHVVHQRTRELGVRLAIGATPMNLVNGVLREGALLVVPGTLVGLLAAAAGAQGVSGVFVGVDVTDPRPYIAVAMLQLVVALAACALPAGRAARIDPLISLRAE